MAKQIKIVCDRCGTGLHAGNWLVDEELCNECSLLVEMGKEFTSGDLSRNLPLGTTLKRVKEMYEDKE